MAKKDKNKKANSKKKKNRVKRQITSAKSIT